MNLRSTLALLVIAMGLGLYVWLVEFRGVAQREAAESAERRLVELSPKAVTKLELPTNGGERARIVRDGDGWRLEAPLAWKANPATVDSALEALADFQLTATVESPGNDFASYGLGAEAQRVDVWTGEGEPTTLYLGKETPVGSLRYVAFQPEPAKLYTVAEAKTGWLMPTLFNLRDKRIVDIDESQVTALRVTAKGSLVAAVERVPAADPNQDASWQLTAPVQEPASETRILRLLSDLQMARAGSFIDAPDGDASYGLDRPEVEIEIVTGDRSEHLAFGAANDDAFLRVQGVATIFQVPDRLLESLPRSALEYRDLQVLSLSESDVARIELEFPRDAKSYTFELDDARWSAVGEDLRLQPLKLEDLLYALESLEASSIEDSGADLAALGLSPPRVRVKARSESGQELGWLELGDPSTETGLAARSSRSEQRVWRVSNELGRDVPLGLDAFQNMFVQSPDAEPAAADAPAEDPS